MLVIKTGAKLRRKASTGTTINGEESIDIKDYAPEERFWYCEGESPVECLKNRVKCCGYSKPSSSAVCAMFFPLSNRFLALAVMY